MSQNQPYQQQYQDRNSATYYNCYFDNDGNIIHRDPYSNKEAIRVGVSMNNYNDMVEARDYYKNSSQEYYDLLIKHKIIEPPKTLEEINLEQSELIKKQNETLDKIMARLEELEKKDIKENELT